MAKQWARRYLALAVAWGVGLEFVWSGGQHLSAPADLLSHYAATGLPFVTLYVIGWMQILGGLSLLFSPTRRFAASAIAVIMVAALTSQISRFGLTFGILEPLAILLATVLIVCMGRPTPRPRLVPRGVSC